MPKLRDVLNSKEFRNASKDDQNAYLQQIGVSRDSAFSMEGVQPYSEPGFIEKTIRSAERGVANAVELLGGIPLAGNIKEGEAPSWIDPYAAKVVDYARQWKEENPTLSRSDDSVLSQGFQGAVESLPYSFAVSGVPMAIEMGVGAATANPYAGVGAGLAANAASFKAQRDGQFVQTYLDKKQEIEQKQGYALTEEQDKNLKKEAWNYAGVSAGSETASDIMPQMALAFMPSGVRNAAKGASKIGAILDTTMSGVAKKAATVSALNLFGEVPTEVYTQWWEDKVTNPNVGLEDQFKQNLVPTIVSTAISSTLFGGTVGAIKGGVIDRSTNKQLQNLLFSDVDLSALPIEEKDKYMQARVQAAYALKPSIEAQVGKEGADNFINHVEQATARTIDPTTPYGRGSLPFNDSIFTKTLEFDKPTTVAPGTTTDIDPTGGSTVPRPPMQPVGPVQPEQPVAPVPVPQPSPQPQPAPQTTPQVPEGKVLTPEEKQQIYQQQLQQARSEQSRAAFNDVLGTGTSGKFSRNMGNGVVRTFTRDTKNLDNIIVTDKHSQIGSQTTSMSMEDALGKLDEAVALNRQFIENQASIQAGGQAQAPQQPTQQATGEIPVPEQRTQIAPKVAGKVFTTVPDVNAETNIISEKKFPSAVGNNTRVSKEQQMWMPINEAVQMMSTETMKPTTNKAGGVGSMNMAQWTQYLNTVQEKGITEPIEVSVKHGESPRITGGIENLEALRQLGYQYVPVNMKYFGKTEAVKEATGIVEKYNKQDIGTVEEKPTAKKVPLSVSENASMEERTYIRDNITGLEMSELIGWLHDNAPDSASKAITAAVQRKLNAMSKSGFSLDMQFKSEPPRNGGITLGYINTANLATNKKIPFGLNTYQNRGFTFTTILHELIHIATVHEIEFNPKVGKEALNLTNKIAKRVSELYKNGDLANVDRETLSNLAYALHANRNVNNLARSTTARPTHGPKELFTVVMTENDVREFLRTIKVDSNRSETLFSTLTNFVRRALGISDNYRTALDEVLDLSMEVLVSKKGTSKVGTKGIKKTNIGILESTNENKITNQDIPKLQGDIASAFKTLPSEKLVVSNTEYNGEKGNRKHVTRDQKAWIPIDEALRMSGVMGEKRTLDENGNVGNYKSKSWEKLLNDIKENGLKEPIFVTVDYGQKPKVSEGNHRIEALKQLGYKYVPADIRYFGKAEVPTYLNENKTEATVNSNEVYPSITGVAKTEIKRVIKNVLDGKLTANTGISFIDTFIRGSEQETSEKRFEKETADLVRGEKWIKAKLATSVYQETITPELSKFLTWFIDKNPAIAKDLAISVVAGRDGNMVGLKVSGEYVRADRILRLFAHDAKDTTGVHELLHHMERMLDSKTRDSIRKMWLSKVNNEFVKAVKGDKKLRASLFEEIIANGYTYGKINKDILYTKVNEALNAGEASMEDYKYFSPSEYWAESLAQREHIKFKGSIWAKAAQQLNTIIEKIKEILGLPSDSVMYRALKDAINGTGDFKNQYMLGDTAFTFDFKQDKAVSDKPELQEKVQAVNSGVAQVIDPGTIKPVPKTTSISHIFSIIEKAKGLKDKVFSNIQLPFIQSIRFNEIFEDELSKKVKEGYTFRDAEALALTRATMEDKNGIVARMLHEEHKIIDESASYKNYLITNEKGEYVVEKAESMRNNLTDAERVMWKDLLYSGDAKATVYSSIEDANKRSGIKVNQAVFDTYVATREAIDIVFRKSNLIRFDRALDSILTGVVTGEKYNDVKAILTQNLMYGYNRLNKRFDNLRTDLRAAGLSEVEIGAVLGGFKRLFRDMRKTLKLYTDGGLTGAVSRFRYSKSENPFVVRIKERVIDKDGKAKITDRYATFFNSQAEADDFAKRINSDDALKSLFRFENINPAAFKDENGKLMISSMQETDAQIAQLYPTHLSEKAMLERLVADTIDTLNSVEGKPSNEIDAKIAEIKKGLMSNINKRYLAASNRKQISRKNKGLIRGYDEVDPLHAVIADASQTSSYLAKTASIERMTDFVSQQKGQRKVDAARELRNSFTKYYDSKDIVTKAASTLTNAATTGFLMGRVVTVFAQAHQYATFGSMELIKAGATPKQAAELLAKNYYKAFSRRVGVSAEEFVKHIKGDKTLAKALRKSLPPGGYKMLIKAFESVAKEERAGTSKKFSQEILEILKHHSDNNDVTDNITKELNNIEDGIRVGAATADIGNKLGDVVRGVSKLGMLMFNEMEIVNREASIISMYEFRRSLGDSKEVADVKATSFMRRVNGDFTRYNKLKILRKNPYLSPIFALTSFMFHSVGILGVRTNQALHGDKGALKSLVAFTVMSTLLGGLKGDPMLDQLNKFFTILLGKDKMLELENAARGGADSGLQKVFADVGFRGLLAPVGLDWTNNVSLRLPFVDTLMDAYTGNTPSVGAYGAGLSWAQGIYRSGKRLYSGEWGRALEEANLGGFSQTAKALRYATEGYTTNKGAPMFFEGEPRKLTPSQAMVLATGFKTPEIARTQDIISSQRLVVDNLWPQRRQEALDSYFKAVNKYILKGESIPDDVMSKAVKSIQDYNNSILKAGPEIASVVKPIKSNDLKNSAKQRFSPNKKAYGYQSSFSNLTDNSNSEEED